MFFYLTIRSSLRKKHKDVNILKVTKNSKYARLHHAQLKVEWASTFNLHNLNTKKKRRTANRPYLFSSSWWWMTKIHLSTEKKCSFNCRKSVRDVMQWSHRNSFCTCHCMESVSANGSKNEQSSISKNLASFLTFVAFLKTGDGLTKIFYSMR